MFACICHAVSDADVAGAIAAGADSVEALGERTSAGTGCGSCCDRLEAMLSECARSCPLAERAGMLVAS